MPQPRKPRTDDKPRVGFRTDQERLDRMDAHRERTGATLTRLMELAIDEYLEKRKDVV